MTIALLPLQTLSAAQAAAVSCARTPVPDEHSASLLVAEITGEAVLLGAFERNLAAVQVPVFRRGTGGGAAHVGPGVVFVQLSLPSPSALTPAGPDQILNRYVRPVLRALTRSGAPAHYFGRDFLSVKHAPAALVAFAHAQATQHTVVEVFIGVNRDAFGEVQRPSFAGKIAGSVSSLTGQAMDVPALIEAISAEFAAAYGHALVPAKNAPIAPAASLALEPAWTSSVDEAIGPVFAGRAASSALRVGGTFMASHDAIARLEQRATTGAHLEEMQAVLDAPGLALFGLKNPRNLLVALESARSQESA